MKIKSSILILILICLNFTSSFAQKKIAVTIYPFKTIIEEISGNKVKVVLIVPPGASPHSFELSPKMMNEVQNSAALFFGAEELDGWALIFGNKNKISLLELIAKDSLLFIHSYSTTGEEKNNSIDPHFWTDPLIVKSILPALTNKLCELDPKNCNTFKSNSLQLAKSLDDLNIELINELKLFKNKRVFLSHPFFQYYLNRYGIDIAGIIEPLPDREPTPKELQKLIELGLQKKIDLILNNTQHPNISAELVSEATGIPILLLDPIGGIKNRISYKEIILYNTNLLVNTFK